MAAEPSAARHGRLNAGVDPDRLDKWATDQGQVTSAPICFTTEQIAECRDLFAMFDKQNDGSIDRAEFGPMMRTIGLNLSERELDNFFAQIDESGDGDIAFEELIEFLEKVSRPITLSEEMSEAFAVFAQASSGEHSAHRVNKKSLAQAFSLMGEEISEEECLDMITAASGGRDEIDFRAFQRLCGAPPPPPGRRRALKTPHVAEKTS
eukprot:TRINITY_DN22647_c0_g2_i1.p1 TRINITY_DN22647_c0_g2~~TRINITY_DN22647_c0_g2_i1.p1  ORF type:complete len:208 (-),score=40.65 TRINITY_DN22647_c0_g2_i1:3-626(-)